MNDLIETKDVTLLTDTKQTSFETMNGQLLVDSMTGVWDVGNSSAVEFINLLMSHGIITPEFFKNDPKVLDLGTGTGILGLYLYKLANNIEVDLVDNNPAAVENAYHNIELNGFDPERIRAILSDGFASLPINNRYKLIIGNLPMNPNTISEAHSNNPGFKSNENGTTGRNLINHAIMYSLYKLEKDGLIVFTGSSRQNEVLTEDHLTSFFRNNWKILNSEVRIINGEEKVEAGQDQDLKDYPGGYHEPYIRTWESQTIINGQFRIFKRDKFGNKILQYEEEGSTDTLFYPQSMPGTLMLCKKNGETHYYFVVDGKLILYEGTDIKIPSWDKKQHYKHKFYVYAAKNAANEG
ncbi:MAG: methyltransferase [Candidatus Dojkabacteria bacterium]